MSVSVHYTENRSGWCEACGEYHRFVRTRVPHRLHFAITIVSAGIWSISWMADVIHSRIYGLRCSTCGARVKPIPVEDTENPTPQSAETEPLLPVHADARAELVATVEAAGTDLPTELVEEPQPPSIPFVWIDRAEVYETKSAQVAAAHHRDS